MSDTHAAEHAGEHPSFLAHHFDTPQQQLNAGKLGMWIFLLTEVLLFGVLFCAYAVYRANHPEVFVWAHQFLDKSLGALNTAILITSSLTMALAVGCAQRGQSRALVACLLLTLLGACGFLGVKFIEYKHKWEAGLLWASRFQPNAEAMTEVTRHPDDPGHRPATLKNEPRNAGIFFSVYFTMTGLHGLHVLFGMAAIAWVLMRALKGQFGAQYFTPVDLVGLYWHLVDLIWIFLFPLLYLIH